MSEQTRRRSLRSVALLGIGTAALSFGLSQIPNGSEPLNNNRLSIPIDTRPTPDVTTPPVLTEGAPTGSEAGGPITLGMFEEECLNPLRPVETSSKPIGTIRPMSALGTLTAPSEGGGPLSRP